MAGMHARLGSDATGVCTYNTKGYSHLKAKFVAAPEEGAESSDGRHWTQFGVRYPPIRCSVSMKARTCVKAGTNQDCRSTSA